MRPRALGLLGVLAASPALGDARRAGATFELGVGIGHEQVVQGFDSGISFESFGVVPLCASVGGFVRDDLAILASSTSLLFRHDRGDGARWYLAQYVGVGAEYWLRADLAVGAAAGLDTIMTTPVENHLARAAGVVLRGKWAATPERPSGLHLVWEINGAVFLDYEVTVSSNLLAVWQWY